jgi:hypothetical protein
MNVNRKPKIAVLILLALALVATIAPQYVYAVPEYNDIEGVYGGRLNMWVINLDGTRSHREVYMGLYIANQEGRLIIPFGEPEPSAGAVLFLWPSRDRWGPLGEADYMIDMVGLVGPGNKTHFSLVGLTLDIEEEEGPPILLAGILVTINASVRYNRDGSVRYIQGYIQGFGADLEDGDYQFTGRFRLGLGGWLA